jgi:translocation and assembly module TamB
MFARDLVSSGTVAATATIRGGFTQPEILGRLDVRNANLSFEGLPNGLSNANGTVIFDPSRATIQSLSAETGGGKVNLTGFVAFSDGPMAMRLEAVAKDVRVRYPEGVSTVANANLRLIGTSERSTLSGTITVIRSAFTPHTDLGQMLASASAPVQTPAVQTGLVGNMQFDVDILTAPDVTFQTNLAQSLQADANMRLRGTLSNPVLLGRVNINQGELTFFGNKYTINDGAISFFNPAKLEPVLDVSLETRARGVDVTINVTGPLNKLNVNYRSDPPLQFSDLVALLATGRTPENPTLAARDPGTSQTWQQMGANALLGQAIANPLAGRLQRFFGVSKIKIDPLLTGVAGNAQARLTIEQPVTPDLTFTYITNVASSTGSAQVIRVEWDFARHWSAVAIRDEYGYFGMDFQYRKRLK